MKREYYINEEQVLLAGIPLEEVKRVGAALVKIANIADKYDCFIYNSPDRVGLYLTSTAFPERGGGIDQEAEIVCVTGPFDGGDY